MPKKIFVYPRCPENERLTAAIYFKYSGGILIELERDDDEITMMVDGHSPVLYEAIKDLMANLCYLVD